MKKAIRIMVLTAISILFLFMLPGEKVSAENISLDTGAGNSKSGTGWNWDGSNNTLTLSGVNITDEGIIFRILHSADMVI